MSYALCFIFIILLAIVVLIILKKRNQCTRPYIYRGGSTPYKKKTLAQKLTSEGWVLYTKSNCPWCVKQISMFGGDACHLKKIDCVDCNLHGEGLKGCQMTWVYPSWVNGTRIEAGTKTLSELKKLLKRR